MTKICSVKDCGKPARFTVGGRTGPLGYPRPKDPEALAIITTSLVVCEDHRQQERVTEIFAHPAGREQIYAFFHSVGRAKPDLNNVEAVFEPLEEA